MHVGGVEDRSRGEITEASQRDRDDSSRRRRGEITKASREITEASRGEITEASRRDHGGVEERSRRGSTGDSRFRRGREPEGGVVEREHETVLFPH